jgi:hypothetical protein
MYPTGTDPASNRTTNGATDPGGMNDRARFTWATTSAIACTMSVPGWKKIFICEKPWMLRLSTWWMPAM